MKRIFSNRRLRDRDNARRPRTFAALKVSTSNVGDHIQILAGLRLLRDRGIRPTVYLDRDNEIGSCARLNRLRGPVGMLLNGWFKTNGAQWPPHPKIQPVFLGFHLRPAVCPELLSDEAISYYRRHGPIGCRDEFTRKLLESKGVDCFESNCLSLTFPRRREDAARQTKVFVVSHDRQLHDAIPENVGPLTHINHYSDSSDFEANMTRARALLETYRTEAKLIITTFLHCALPAIAMGIPVVVFFPVRHGAKKRSDRERFSSLEKLVPVYDFEDAGEVNWEPSPVDVDELKQSINGRFDTLIQRWSAAPPEPSSPAPSAAEGPLP